MKSRVELISYTRSVTRAAELDLEEYVAYVARISNPGNQHNTGSGKRLLTYLMDNEHWSPFEMANVCVEINTTRDIARQILRHRSFSFQEFSQRYAVVEEDEEVVREARMQDVKNRQNSIETDDAELQAEWLAQQRAAKQAAVKAYFWALQRGVAKEVARAVLPEGLTSSRLYMNGSLRSWMHYIALRTDASTQKEHREVARACAVAISEPFPMIMQFVWKEKNDE